MDSLRVVIRNTSLKVTLKCKSVLKNLESGFFVSLTSSHDFLSVIFGIFGKFWIDLGVQIWSSILKTGLVVPDYIHIRRNLGFGVLTPVTVATNRLSGTGTCTNCFWVSKMLFSRKTCAGVLRTGHLSLVQQHTLHVVHLLPACICISINLDQEDFLGLCWRIILAPHLKPGKQAPWNIDGSPPPTHPQTVIPDTRLASPA